MGAWGTELLENDMALDAVEAMLAGRFGPVMRRQLMNNIRRDYEEAGVLGVAQALYLIDDYALVEPDVMAVVRACITHQLSKPEIENWKDPEKRRLSLHEFQTKLERRKRRLEPSRG